LGGAQPALDGGAGERLLDLQAQSIAAPEIKADRRGQDEEAVALRRADADIAVGGGHDWAHIERIAGPRRYPRHVDPRERRNRLDEGLGRDRWDAETHAGCGEAGGVPVRAEKTDHAVVTAIGLESFEHRLRVLNGDGSWLHRHRTVGRDGWIAPGAVLVDH